ncbi:hypothetical protein AJ78_01710 [Emergomyces pasteurianus Ep9510]|uniref:Uncharacterized protein n=1 Tax=Emergomyces pasteurianus Ep9510 TaxID=1447872 RepID=A0A1J9QQ13_9EURO|nr:hypothetical protein AJ78_01710 [Emergomyces pasteurianus Ep9510]
MLRPHALSSLTIFIFGLSALLHGIHTLLHPSAVLISLGLPATALPAINATSLAAIAMGIYYTLAAYQRNKSFYALTVPMRFLTASVFWNQARVSVEGRGWRTAALWEGGGALVTGLALFWEWGVGTMRW